MFIFHLKKMLLLELLIYMLFMKLLYINEYFVCLSVISNDTTCSINASECKISFFSENYRQTD